MQGHPTMSINGIGMAGKGIWLPVKVQRTFSISEGLDSFTLPSDIPVALADMKTACGARLLPSSFLVVVEPSSPFGSQLTGNPNDENEETVPPQKILKVVFNWLTKILDSQLLTEKVRVTLANGISTIYASDEQGFTDWVYTPSEEEVHLNLVDELDNG